MNLTLQSKQHLMHPPGSRACQRERETISLKCMQALGRDESTRKGTDGGEWRMNTRVTRVQGKMTQMPSTWRVTLELASKTRGRNLLAIFSIDSSST